MIYCSIGTYRTIGQAGERSMYLDAEVYGRAWAEDYDVLTPITPAMTATAIARLARLADGGPVLEVAAGTGRLSIGLADLGLAVTATDISSAMLDQLRVKDPTGRVTIRQEPMQQISGDERYALVVCAYNAIICLTSQDDQLAVFTGAARHLRPGGFLVIESLLLDPRAFKEARPLAMTADSLMARFGSYDVYSQKLEQYYLVARAGEPVSFRPDVSRLVTPAELDLMAPLVGLRLHERTSTWTGAPVTGPGNVISIYELSP